MPLRGGDSFQKEPSPAMAHRRWQEVAGYGSRKEDIPLSYLGQRLVDSSSQRLPSKLSAHLSGKFSAYIALAVMGIYYRECPILSRHLYLISKFSKYKRGVSKAGLELRLCSVNETTYKGVYPRATRTKRQ